MILSNAQGVAVIDNPNAPPPDVFVVPDEYDYDEGSVVLVDDDDEDARRLMGTLNMDGMPD